VSVQGLIVLAGVALAGLYFARKLFRNLARKGQAAGCGCGERDCCKAKRN